MQLKSSRGKHVPSRLLGSLLHRIATLILTSLTLCLSVEAGKCEGKPKNDSAPNIIFILADDLGYGDLGCFGQKVIQTPNLDRMAAQGMRFTDCYAGSTVCAPSRCCLMTGLDTGHALVRGNARVPLRPEDVTVAEVLERAGYRTGIIGKWGLGEPDSTGIPNRQGFDYWFGYLNQRHAHNYYPAYLWHNQGKVLLRNEVNHMIHGRDRTPGGVATKRVDYSHDLFTAEALAFLDRSAGDTFFTWRTPCRTPTTRRAAKAWKCRTSGPTPTRIGPNRKKATPQ